MTDLDRYGLFALAVVILLILFVSLGEMDPDDGSPDHSDSFLKGGVPARGAEGAEEDIGIVDGESESVLPGGRDGFDFGGDPVTYQGAPRRSDGEGSDPGPRDGAIRHKVRKGESLSSLSRTYYGSISYWPRIARANGGLSPEKMQVGMSLLIPPLGAEKKTSTSAQTTAPRKHIVKKNDSLVRISKQYYGTTSKWRRIYDANREKISDPDVLKLGVCLVVPR